MGLGRNVCPCRVLAAQQAKGEVNPWGLCCHFHGSQWGPPGLQPETPSTPPIIGGTSCAVQPLMAALPFGTSLAPSWMRQMPCTKQRERCRPWVSAAAQQLFCSL